MKKMVFPDNPTLSETKTIVAQLVTAVVSGTIDRKAAREGVKLGNKMVRRHEQELKDARNKLNL